MQSHALSVANLNPAKKQYTYARHQPEETVLYKLIQNNWLPFQEQVLRDTGYPRTDFVVKEFEEYLCCGILAEPLMKLKIDLKQYLTTGYTPSYIIIPPHIFKMKQVS